MFRFFRKHAWILTVAMALTIISFVVYMGSGPAKNNRYRSGSDNLGKIYGRAVTQDDHDNMKREVDLLYFTRYGEWPDRISSLPKDQIKTDIYVRIMLIRKAADMGIHISDDAAANYAKLILSSQALQRVFGKSGSVPFDEFKTYILDRNNLSTEDFSHLVHDQLAIEQLQEIIGLSGSLVTPQEATAFYQRQHQEVSAEMVYFSASNYLSQVAVTPAAIGTFYTNYMAAYRLPDRIQISYVEFDITNYEAAAEQKIGRTNLNYQVENIFRQRGREAVPEAKTDEEAKAKIREYLLMQAAHEIARTNANAFADVLYAKEPAKAENLAAVAKEKGLTVHATAPFDNTYGPSEIRGSADFIKSVFGLTPDVPLAGPIASGDSLYVVALTKQLPSEIPSLDQIRDRVTQDYKFETARAMAYRNGTNAVHLITAQMAAGKTFASACVGVGLAPEVLPPFSLSSQEVAGFNDRNALNELKKAAFLTPAGKASGFEPTEDGGFVVYVKSMLPLDEATKSAQLPQYIAQVRRERQNEAFQEWVNTEARSQLSGLPELQRDPGMAQ